MLARFHVMRIKSVRDKYHLVGVMDGLPIRVGSGIKALRGIMDANVVGDNGLQLVRAKDRCHESKLCNLLWQWWRCR